MDAQTAYEAGYSDAASYTHNAEAYAPFEADYEAGQRQADKDDYDSEASLRDAESGAAYERFMDAWAHSVESPLEAEREEAALQDFEAQLAACPNGSQNNDDLPF